MNDLSNLGDPFAGIAAWRGEAPEGFDVDFAGGLFDVSFHIDVPGSIGHMPEPPPRRHLETRLPELADGESFFEALDVIEAIRAAGDRFTMIELGGGWGPRCVMASRLLDAIRPLPRKFVVVEPEPNLHANAQKHFANNGLDPAEHWFPNVAVTHDGLPTLILIGRGRASNGRFFPHNADKLFQALRDANVLEQACRNLLVNMRMGVRMEALVEGEVCDVAAVSCLRFRDLLDPFDVVDLIDVDIQGDEAAVIPPNIELLGRKVRRLHIGTHTVPAYGPTVHADLHRCFEEAGWEIVFSFAPGGRYQTPRGDFELPHDGVLTVRNPKLT